MSIPNPVSPILPKLFLISLFHSQILFAFNQQQQIPGQPNFRHQNQLFPSNSLQFQTFPSQSSSLSQDGPNSISQFGFRPKHMTHGCKHFCSISKDDSIPCWNDTLHYYEQMLVGTLRRTIAVQSNRVVWMIANGKQQKQIDFALLANECFQRLKNMPMRQRVEDHNNWKNADFVYLHLSTALVENVQNEMNKMIHNHYGDEFPMLDVECPHGCERSWDTWKWLFIGSLSATFILLTFLAFFVIRLDQREKNSWNLEAEEYRTAKTIRVCTKYRKDETSNFRNIEKMKHQQGENRMQHRKVETSTGTKKDETSKNSTL